MTERNPLPLCRACHGRLNPEEAHYYEDRCEECERAWHDRVVRWESGGADMELDALFNEPFG